MKWLLNTGIAAVLIFLSAAPVIAQDKETDMQAISIPAPLDRLVAVINGGDTEGYLALLTEDIIRQPHDSNLRSHQSRSRPDPSTTRGHGF